MSQNTFRTINVRLPRTSCSFALDVDLSGSATAAIGKSIARGSSFDPTRFKFVVSPTETTPGMIISSDMPLDQYNFSDINDVIELWVDPDVLRLRAFAWSAGSEDKPTVLGI